MNYELKRGGAAVRKLITGKGLFFLALAAFLLSMIPIFIMAGYTLPFYDDYNYGYLTARAWAETGSLIEVLKAAAEQVKITYRGWQGTFSGIFFMALSPGIFNEFLYPIGIVFLIILFCGGNFFFLKVVLKDCLGIEKYSAGIITILITFLSFQFAVSPSEGFLWYNGGFYYTGFYSLTLLMFSALLISCRTEKRHTCIISGILAVIIAFMVGGSNFVLGLTACVSLALFGGYWGVLRKKRFLFPLLSFAAVVIAFLINVTAPGNNVRQDYFESPGAVGSILKSVFFGIEFLTDKIKLPIVFGFLTVLPLIYRGAAKSEYSFRYPAIVTILSYLVYACGFTPAFYGMGWEGPERAQNLSFFIALIMILLNLYYWCGWMGKTGELKARFSSSGKGRGAQAVLFCLLMLCFIGSLLGMALEDRDSLTSVSAVTSIRNGDAEGFYQERLHQLELLKDPEITNPIFERHKYKPALLYHTNLADDPENSVNRCTAKYYGKETVVCLPES